MGVYLCSSAVKNFALLHASENLRQSESSADQNFALRRFVSLLFNRFPISVHQQLKLVNRK